MIAAEIRDILIQRQETLALAESCSGGGLANEITACPGVSSMFLGGIVAYANEVKINLLNVDKTILARKGAVSEDVALLMAKNCQAIFNATWALATTGIAGPDGATDTKPVGLVYIALAGPNILNVHQFIFSNIARLEHKKQTTYQALTLLKTALT